MTDIVERLRNACTDWDGSILSPSAEPMDWTHCDILFDAADEIKASHVALMIANGEIERLNDALSEAEKDRDGEREAKEFADENRTFQMERAEKAEAELAQARKALEAFRSERSYVIGVNDGWDEAIEQAASIAGEMRKKHGAPVGSSYECGVWDQGVRIEQSIRALITDTGHTEGEQP